MRGFVSSCSQISGSRDSSSIVSSTIRPTWTFETPSKPSAGSARSTVCPCGSRIPSLGRIRTRFLMPANDPKSPDAKEEGPGKCSARLGPDDAGSRRFAGSLAAGTPEPLGERLAGQPLVRVHVEVPRTVDHLFRQRRRRRRLVPAGLGCPIANVLLVERRLAVARFIALGRPEA